MPMRRIVLVAVAVLTLSIASSRSAFAQSAPTADPDHAWRAFKGVGVGVVAGGALAGGLAYLAVRDCSDLCFQELMTAIIGGQLVFSLGLSTSLSKFGNHAGGRGSFGRAFGFALLGGTLSLVSIVSDSLPVIVASNVTLTTLGATLGYWTSHHDDAGGAPAMGALLQLRDGRLGLGVPVPIVIGADTSRGPGVLLLGGSF